MSKPGSTKKPSGETGAGEKRPMEVKQLGVSDRLVDYFFANIQKSIFNCSLLLGWLILFGYFLSIGYFPEFSGNTQNELLSVLLGAFLVGILSLSMLGISLVLPGLAWNWFSLPKDIGKCGVVILLFYIVFSYGCLIWLKSETVFGFPFFLGWIVLGLVFYKWSAEWKKDWESEKAVAGFKVFFGWLVCSALPILSLMTSLKLLNTSETQNISIPQIWGVPPEVVVVTVILIVGFALNAMIALSKIKFSGTLVAIAASMMIVVFISPKLVPYSTASILKVGHYHADLILNEQGCRVVCEYLNVSDVKDSSEHKEQSKKPLESKGVSDQKKQGKKLCNLEVKKQMCRYSNVLVYSSIGSKILVEFQSDKKDKLILDKKDVLALSLPNPSTGPEDSGKKAQGDAE